MAKTSHKISIKAPTDQIFKALSTTEGLKGWYTPNVEGKVGEGKEATFKFTGEKPFRWKFAELAPGSRVRWECLEGPGAAGGTVVTFRLSDRGDGRTAVECDHDNWPDGDGAFTSCNTLWGILMGQLKTYAETGMAHPAFN
jgi:uncharacterized protein YndB with AHSA1/START domain